jgi:hypothetical protein
MDSYWLLGLLMLAVMPLIFLMRPAARN